MVKKEYVAVRKNRIMENNYDIHITKTEIRLEESASSRLCTRAAIVL